MGSFNRADTRYSMEYILKIIMFEANRFRLHYGVNPIRIRLNPSLNEKINMYFKHGLIAKKDLYGQGPTLFGLEVIPDPDIFGFCLD